LRLNILEAAEVFGGMYPRYCREFFAGGRHRRKKRRLYRVTEKGRKLLQTLITETPQNSRQGLV